MGMLFYEESIKILKLTCFRNKKIYIFVLRTILKTKYLNEHSVNVTGRVFLHNLEKTAFFLRKSSGKTNIETNSQFFNFLLNS